MGIVDMRGPNNAITNSNIEAAIVQASYYFSAFAPLRPETSTDEGTVAGGAEIPSQKETN